MGTKIIEPRPAFCFSLQGRRPAGRIEAETPLPFGALPIQDPFRILSRIFATYDMGSKSSFRWGGWLHLFLPRWWRFIHHAPGGGPRLRHPLRGCQLQWRITGQCWQSWYRHALEKILYLKNNYMHAEESFCTQCQYLWFTGQYIKSSYCL